MNNKENMSFYTQFQLQAQTNHNECRNENKSKWKKKWNSNGHKIGYYKTISYIERYYIEFHLSPKGMQWIDSMVEMYAMKHWLHTKRIISDV